MNASRVSNEIQRAGTASHRAASVIPLIAILLAASLMPTKPAAGGPPRMPTRPVQRPGPQWAPAKADPLQPLRDELQRIRDRNDDLRKQIADAKKRQRDSERSGPAMQAELDKLTAEIDILRRWQQATFVLGDTRSTDAVAIQAKSDQFILAGKASGGDVRPRVAAAAKAKVVRVATEDGRSMARRIAAAFEPGDTLTDEYAADLKARIWTVRDLLPSFADGDLKFVVFRDSQKSKQQVGIVGRVEPDALWFQPAGAKELKKIERSRVQPGSVRADLGKEILDAVDGDEAFLDVCVLSLAQQLSKAGREPGHMAVGIEVNLDGLDGSINEEQRRVENELIIEPWRLFPWFPISGKLDLSFNVPDRNASLKRVARNIEDSLYAKLLDSGFPIVEKEHVEAVRDARSKLSGAEIGPLLNATHIIAADVDYARKRGMYRLAIRLIDVRSGNPIWSVNSEPTCPKIYDKNPYFVHSGTLASISLDKNAPSAKNVTLKGLETPLRVELAVAKFNPQSVTQQLVLLEPSSDKTEVAYRSLFDREIHRVPAAAVKVKPLPSGIDQLIAEIARDGSLSSQLTRAVVWEMCNSGLTPAGRITEILEDGKAMRVSLGRLDGVLDDTTFRVMRPRGVDPASGEPSDFPLPITLKVRSIDDHGCVVIPIHLGLDGYWEEDGMIPRVGDVAYNPYEAKRKIAVFPPENRSDTLSPEDRTKLGGRNAKHWAKIVSDADELADTAKAKIRNGLIKLSDAFEAKGVTHSSGFGRSARSTLDIVATCTAAAKNGATHAVGGYIQPSKTARPEQMNYEVKLILYELSRDADGRWKPGREVLALPELKLGARSWD